MPRPNGATTRAKVEITPLYAKSEPLAQVVWSPNGSTTYSRYDVCSTSS